MDEARRSGTGVVLLATAASLGLHAAILAFVMRQVGPDAEMPAGPRVVLSFATLGSARVAAVEPPAPEAPAQAIESPATPLPPAESRTVAAEEAAPVEPSPPEPAVAPLQSAEAAVPALSPTPPPPADLAASVATPPPPADAPPATPEEAAPVAPSPLAPAAAPLQSAEAASPAAPVSSSAPPPPTDLATPSPSADARPATPEEAAPVAPSPLAPATAPLQSAEAASPPAPADIAAPPAATTTPVETAAAEPNETPAQSLAAVPQASAESVPPAGSVSPLVRRPVAPEPSALLPADSGALPAQPDRAAAPPPAAVARETPSAALPAASGTPDAPPSAAPVQAPGAAVATLEAPLVSTARIRGFVDRYDGGACFFASVARATSRGADIETFSETVDQVMAFHAGFMGQLGVEPDVVGQRVWTAQCPAVDFLRRTRAEGTDPLALEVDRRELRGNEALTGRIRGSGSRRLGLFLVSETGAVADVTDAVRRTGDDAVFALPPSSGAPGGPYPEMLIAAVLPSASATGVRSEIASALSSARDTGVVPPVRSVAKLVLVRR